MPDRKLNPGWTWVAFGDVVSLSKERSNDPQADGFERYVGLEHLDPEDLKIRRWGDTSDGTSFTSVFQPGQVLFGKRRAYQRKVAVADFSGVCSSDIYVFEPKDRRLLLELLPFICQTDAFFEHALSTSAGSLSPRTNWKSLANYEFALPPLEEQWRISEVLQAYVRYTDSLTKTCTTLRKLREAYAKSIWLESSSKLWSASLSEICVKIQDGTHFSPKSSSGEFRYVTSKNIKDGYIDLADSGRISREEHENIYKRCDVKLGDILLTKDGVNVGNLAVNTLIEPFSLLSSVALIRPKEDQVDTRYLFEYLRSVVGRRMIMAEVKGSAITRITLERIRALKVQIHSLEDQHQHSERFGKYDVALSEVRRKRDLATRLQTEARGMVFLK